MTYQRPDTLQFEDKVHCILDRGQLRPSVGMYEPDGRWVPTGCWRGHIARWRLVDDQLQLGSLSLYVHALIRRKVLIGKGEPLYGRYPVWDEKTHMLQLDHLEAPIAYSGSLVICSEEAYGAAFTQRRRTKEQLASMRMLKFQQGRLVAKL